MFWVWCVSQNWRYEPNLFENIKKVVQSRLSMVKKNSNSSRWKRARRNYDVTDFSMIWMRPDEKWRAGQRFRRCFRSHSKCLKTFARKQPILDLKRMKLTLADDVSTEIWRSFELWLGTCCEIAELTGASEDCLCVSFHKFYEWFARDHFAQTRFCECWRYGQDLRVVLFFFSGLEQVRTSPSLVLNAI